MNTTLSCMNCGKQLDQQTLELFAGVGVCPECKELAEHIMARGQAELRTLMTLMKEVVRTSLIEGSLRFPVGKETPASKSEVLGMIVTMKEAHERRKVGRNAGQVRAGVH